MLNHDSKKILYAFDYNRKLELPKIRVFLSDLAIHMHLIMLVIKALVQEIIHIIIKKIFLPVFSSYLNLMHKPHVRHQYQILYELMSNRMV